MGGCKRVKITDKRVKITELYKEKKVLNCIH